MKSKLGDSQLTAYLRQQHPLKRLERDQGLLRATKVDGGKRVSRIFSVSRQEWASVLSLVVLPFFQCSRELYAAVFVESNLRLLHRGKLIPFSGEDLGEGPSSLPTCLSRPGCVKLWDKKGEWEERRGGKKRKELCTACVFPAARSKIVHPVDKSVSWSIVEGYYKVSFKLEALIVAEVNRSGSWVAKKSRLLTHSVELRLHHLIWYLSTGCQSWQECALTQSQVILHIGECKPGCCCPWHLKLGTKSENEKRARLRPARANGVDGRAGSFSPLSYRVEPN